MSLSPLYSYLTKRFARQQRYGPPPEFPLASTYTSIVHWFSGVSLQTKTQGQREGCPPPTALVDGDGHYACPPSLSLSAPSPRALNLACKPSSLVRVSRRDARIPYKSRAANDGTKRATQRPEPAPPQARRRQTDPPTETRPTEHSPGCHTAQIALSSPTIDPSR